MRYKIHTAPIIDAFKERGCPICKLKALAADELLRQYSNEAVMESVYRIELNKRGLCALHAEKITEASKLASALQLSTRAEYLKNALVTPTKKNCVKVAEARLAMARGCLICEETQKTLLRYAETCAAMYAHEADFKPLLASAECFCEEHYALLLSTARAAGAQTDEYLRDITKIQSNTLSKLKNNLELFAELFDYKKGGNPTPEVKESPTKAPTLICRKQ